MCLYWWPSWFPVGLFLYVRAQNLSHNWKLDSMAWQEVLFFVNTSILHYWAFLRRQSCSYDYGIFYFLEQQVHTNEIISPTILPVSLSDDNATSQLHGTILLPVSIAFMCYSMHQYGRRAQLIWRRAPGPYEDIIGPAVLFWLLLWCYQLLLSSQSDCISLWL